MDCDFPGFIVSNFTHQNLVRVVTQDAPQDRTEGNANVRIDRALHDAFDVIFDRVFAGDDLGGNIVQFVQGGVQSRGLAAAGRTGHQHDPVRQFHHSAETTERGCVHADFVQVQSHHGSVKDPHDDRFAEQHRQHTDSQVHLVATDV